MIKDEIMLLIEAEAIFLELGRSPLVLGYDDHIEHIESHIALLRDLRLKSNPKVVEAVRKHIEAHMDLMIVSITNENFGELLVESAEDALDHAKQENCIINHEEYYKGVEAGIKRGYYNEHAIKCPECGKHLVLGNV